MKILVSRNMVEHNHQTGDRQPVFVVVDADGNRRDALSVSILGPCEIRYDPTGQIGSRIWIETDSDIQLQTADGEKW